MTEEREQIDALPTAGEPDGADQIIPPSAPPMDDAAGGPQAEDAEKSVDDDTDATSTDDLTVQGGE